MIWGHGPFSHAFESVTIARHEEMTRRIILEDTEVHRALVRCSPSLPEKVAAVIDHTHPNKILVQMISGQLDADPDGLPASGCVLHRDEIRGI